MKIRIIDPKESHCSRCWIRERRRGSVRKPWSRKVGSLIKPATHPTQGEVRAFLGYPREGWSSRDQLKLRAIEVTLGIGSVQGRVIRLQMHFQYPIRDQQVRVNNRVVRQEGHILRVDDGLWHALDRNGGATVCKTWFWTSIYHIDGQIVSSIRNVREDHGRPIGAEVHILIQQNMISRTVEVSIPRVGRTQVDGVGGCAIIPETGRGIGVITAAQDVPVRAGPQNSTANIVCIGT